MYASPKWVLDVHDTAIVIDGTLLNAWYIRAPGRIDNISRFFGFIQVCCTEMVSTLTPFMSLAQGMHIRLRRP